MTSRRGSSPSTRRGALAAAVGLLAMGLAFAASFGHASSAVAADASAPTTSTSIGAAYWLEASDGGVYQFGTTNFGSLRGHALNKPVVGGTATADGLGYWLVASDGGVFSFGDAPFDGSTGGIHLNKPIVGMAADPATHGYWLTASDGGVFAFGSPFYGSTGGIHLNKPVVAMIPTPDGRGYWLVASDGGVFSFGDAGFYGSAGAVHLAKPIVGMAATPDGRGYWLVASDGGVFSFGDAGFYGSAGAVHLAKPVVGLAASPDGRGYWLVASDGGLFSFGDAPFLGSATSSPKPIVGIMATPYGYPFVPGSTGYDISKFQCPPYSTPIPPSHPEIRIVQVSGGSIDNPPPSSCYTQEAAWAGVNMSAYIFMDGLPATVPAEAKTGPAGTCDGNVACEAYNFGWYWARHWVDFSRAAGVSPTLWWLDVETDGDWSYGASDQAANARVIEGAVAGLRSADALPGIYATAYQWGRITGNDASFPGIALWVPGAGDIRSGTYSAQAICGGQLSTYGPFAGGRIILVQYGYVGSGYSGPSSPYDQDYACR